MIGAQIGNTWVSRLRTTDFSAEMGFDPAMANEIPHVSGLPVNIPLPEGATVVREWPNLAGRLEPAIEGDLVRWDRSLAPSPPTGTVIARGVPTDEALLSEIQRWFARFVRGLTQIPGIVAATPSDTPRVVILTPGGIPDGSGPIYGLAPVPDHLAEFPGGIILTMNADSFDRRSQYADAVRGVFDRE